jgi:RNA polymerase sigma factor (sigma-70 family)
VSSQEKGTPMDTVEMQDALAAQAPELIDNSRLLDLERTYILHRPSVVHSLIKRGIDAIEAEDVTQEVFLRVLGCPTTFCSQSNMAGWLKTCARNLAVDRYRRNRKEVLVQTSVWERWEEERPAAVSGIEASVLQANCGHRLRNAISQLTEQEQQCLAMRIRGVTFREIAAAFDISRCKAAYLVEAAVEKLRRKLQPTVACRNEAFAVEE